ncbi:protease modulator HflC [Candidatus Riesia pediculicola]|uniref:protease modulator HflC n=1 Tax=Candidatus Riesia pediculicola TaxID=401619 RepID=UPI003B968E06
MIKKFLIGSISFLIISSILYESVFIVHQIERGIILRFGKVLRKDGKPIIYEPGLHLKTPFIEKVKMLDSRIRTVDVQADRYLTRENKDLIVDSYLKWKVIDFSKYYVATGGGDVDQTETLLKRKFSDRLRSEFGRLNVKNIIMDSRGRMTIDVRDSLNHGTITDPSKGLMNQSNLFHESLEEKRRQIFERDVSSNSMAILGVKVVDVRIKRIELPSEVSEAIYQRMRAERESVARRHRSQGKEEALKIRAVSDKSVTEILAAAECESLRLKGEGDAIAAHLYAKAFDKDPEFYSFFRILKAYEKNFGKKRKNNLMILGTSSSFFRYIRSSNIKN